VILTLRRCCKLAVLLGWLLGVELVSFGASQRGGGKALQFPVLLANDILNAAYPANQPGAAVLIARGDQVLLRKGYGLAELDRRTPMRPDRQFRIASISKQFTAVAVLQLVAAGRLRLDDDAAAVDPELWALLPGVHVTVRQLLTHTSGLRNYSDLDRFRDQPTRTMSVSYLLGLIAEHPLRFAPGTAWEYSNTGYLVLAELVERVTGQPFDAYLARSVFAPAGLTRTVAGSAGTGEGAGIAGYSPVIGHRGQFQRAVRLNLSQALGAGSLVSCVDDLWKWERAVNGGRVLPAQLVQAAWAPVDLRETKMAGVAASLAFGDGRGASPGAVPYGFGWELNEVSHHAAVGHGGTLSGYRSYEVQVPDLNLFIAILCNCDRPENDPAQVAATLVAALERG
jgi:CubicO group peptidase (beta-lactamase class C family)